MKFRNYYCTLNCIDSILKKFNEIVEIPLDLEFEIISL